MPIKRENWGLYPGGSPTSKEWQAIRARILRRAGNRCERCRAPNGEYVVRFEIDRRPVYAVPGLWVFDSETGAFVGDFVQKGIPPGKRVRIVLTVMHLEHDPTKNGDLDLLAGCQRCHNRHDAAHRQANAARTRRAKGPR